jgi:hypothetical protein
MRQKPEEKECVKLVKYLNKKGLKHTHINNSMYTDSWNQLKTAKRMSVSPGFPDYIIIIDKKYRKKGWSHIIFCEMKREKGGVVSKAQKVWIEALKECEGVNAFVAHGADDAISYIASFIETEPPEPVTTEAEREDFINNL